MQTVRALGIMANDPQRGHIALYALRGLAGLPAHADAFGVAACVDRSVLLTRRPAFQGDEPLHAVVGPLRGRTNAIQFRCKGDVRPKRELPTNVGPFRAREFACSVIGGPQTADACALLRDRWLATLPDFLRRHIEGESEAEAFFFAALAVLHKSGQLDRAAGPEPQAIVDAVGGLYDESHGPRAIQFISATLLVHVAFDMPSALFVTTTLNQEEADAVDPTLADSSIGRERLRRFRCVTIATGLDGSPAGELPKGVTLTDQPARGAVIVRKDLEPIVSML